MPPLVLSEEEVQHFQALALSRSLPHSIVQRAQIVLGCGAGESNTAIAKRKGADRGQRPKGDAGGAGTITMRGGHKKAPPKAGPENESRMQSGLGRGDQRSGDAHAEATAPAEGSSGTEQGQGAGDSCSWWSRGPDDHLD